MKSALELAMEKATQAVGGEESESEQGGGSDAEDGARATGVKKVKKGVRIFVPPSLSLIVENLTLRVFGIMISENLGSIS